MLLRRVEQAGGQRRADQDHGYVFTWPDGRPLHPENIANWFEQHTRAAGLPRIRLTCATATPPQR